MQGFHFQSAFAFILASLISPNSKYSSLAPEENVSFRRFLGYPALFEEIQPKLKSTFLPSISFDLHMA